MILTNVKIIALLIFQNLMMSSSNENILSNKYCEKEDMNCFINEFPKTIKEFGYYFNEYGQLRHSKTNEPFKFEVKEEDYDYNQRHYEILGELVTDYVYELLINDTGLVKKYIPFDASSDEPQTFVFMSNDVVKNQDKLLVLIHGSGVVRAGQWARRLIINDCLDSGTQLPFIKRAQGLGFSVVVLNTNDNYKEINNQKVYIRGSENSDNHALYVWKNIIQKTPAKNIAIIAHSYGGVVTMNLLNMLGESFQNRVFAIALTDSVHSLSHQKVNSQAIQWLQKVARNWVSSSQPLDTPLRTDQYEVPCVSAGDKRHEMTSWSSFASIFEFLDHKYQKSILNKVKKTKN
ncbi:protein FAM172A-like [Centruroides sculpturatus]|uniref:protein FAM172A-like n=1 Tax=Centruroides sculpturatus TaxID=218467 RepID=UPI000C6D68F3|nr:protein FAM172A-like [Centruroides sculpturatus]